MDAIFANIVHFISSWSLLRNDIKMLCTHSNNVVELSPVCPVVTLLFLQSHNFAFILGFKLCVKLYTSTCIRDYIEFFVY